MENMDYDITNYSIDELYELLELDKEDIMDYITITNKADELIKKYNSQNNEKLKNFFIDVKKKLLDYLYTSSNQETLIIQNNDDENDNGIDIELKNIQNNPKFDNTIKRMINIDSSYRLNSFPLQDDTFRYNDLTNVETTIYSNTNFTCNLTEKLTNLLSISMHSIQIPYSWYSINRFNNMFKIDDTIITVNPGNYTVEELVNTLNNTSEFNTFGRINYTNVTCKVDISLNDVKDIIFYETVPEFINSKSNHNLGWMLGFRNSKYNGNYITAEAMANTNGPKYLTLVVDEFKSNISNKGLVSIETSENKLSLPSYFSNDMTFTVLNTDNGEVPQYSNIRNINSTLTSKTITKAQETTINEIIKSRNNTIKLNCDYQMMIIHLL